MSSDADPAENDTNSNNQHATLLNLSTTEVDVGAIDNKRDCTIHPKTTSHMD